MDSFNKPKGNGNQPMNCSDNNHSQSQQEIKLPQTQLEEKSQAQTQLQSICKYEKIMNLSRLCKFKFEHNGEQSKMNDNKVFGIGIIKENIFLFEMNENKKEIIENEETVIKYDIQNNTIILKIEKNNGDVWTVSICTNAIYANEILVFLSLINSANTASASSDRDNESENKTDGDLNQAEGIERQKVVLKIAVLGDSQTGLDNLLNKYIDDEDSLDELGMNFREKEIHLKNVDVTMSIWYLREIKEEFETLMQLCCVDAQVIIFGFDLTREESLFSVKRWYKETKKENKDFMPFLIGTRFHFFEHMSEDYKDEITKYARKFSQKMDAPLIYASEADRKHVQKIFKIIVGEVFDLNPKIKASKKQNQNKNGNQNNSQNNESIGNE